MGCDIHIYAEVKKNGIWEKVGAVFDDPYYDPERETSNWNHPKTDQPYEGRNYDLFAMLANVRNGYGFAGCDTGIGFIPIDMPRGLPRDVSLQVRLKSDDWGCDGHSHSWLLLSELLAYDWKGQITTKVGVVTKEQYKQFLAGEPHGYCGGAGGGRVVHVLPEEILSTPDDDGYYYYTKVRWNATYEEQAGKRFLDGTINALKELGEPDSVRIVFWFDN